MSQIPAPNIASPSFKANPYPFYARLRAEAPAYRVILPSKQPAWLITRYDDVLAVLKEDRITKDRLRMQPSGDARAQWMPGLLKPIAQNMLDLDAPDHTRLRALVHKAFTPRLIERLRERIQSLCDDLLTSAQRNGGFDLIHEYALPLPATIIAELLGVPPEDRRAFHRWSSSMVVISSGGDLLRALPHIWMFMRYVRRMIARRRADPRDDLMTALVQAEESGDSMSEDELIAMVVLLLIAGHETTVNLIASGTLALLEHPEQLALLRRDPDLIKPAIEELLRYTSPVDLATERFAKEDLPIAGAVIPRGEQVLAVIGSANRDERQFRDPDTLDITRDPNRHLAFGQGIHYCLGAPLARLEGQIAVTTLLNRAPDLRLRGAAEDLRWRKGLFVRGLRQLPILT